MSTALTCPVPGCGRDFKDKTGLASHMAFAHSMRPNGDQLPPDYLEARRKSIQEGQQARQARFKRSAGQKQVLPMHTPEARAKARTKILARLEEKRQLTDTIDAATDVHDSSGYYLKLQEKGIFRCPECSKNNHKIRDFPTATELGKHRRFAHGVLGRHHLKSQEALERRHANAAPAQADASGNTSDRIQCPHCTKTLKNRHGLSIHINHFHKTETSLVPLTSRQELIHGNGSTQGVLNGHAGRGHSNDAAYITALAVSNLTGKLQSIILAASDEYDLPPRQLARRCILALSEHYSS